MDDLEDRENNVQVSFDKNVPRPSAFEVHKWMEEDLKLPDNEVLGLQLDTIELCLFLKLQSPELCQSLVSFNNGTRKFKHANGRVSDVYLSHAGFGLREVKVFNLPFETRLDTIKRYLSLYGQVFSVKKEKWSSQYRYQVDKGIRTVKMVVHQHIPSFLKIAGHRAFIVYDGQPPTCSLCSSADHLRGQCPTRRRQGPVQLPLESQGGGRPRVVPYAAVAMGSGPARRERLVLEGGNVVQLDTSPALTQATTSLSVTETVTVTDCVLPTVTVLNKPDVSASGDNSVGTSASANAAWHTEVEEQLESVPPVIGTNVAPSPSAVAVGAGLEPATTVPGRQREIVQELLSSEDRQSPETNVLLEDMMVENVLHTEEQQDLSPIVDVSVSAPVQTVGQPELFTVPHGLPPKPRRASLPGRGGSRSRSRSGSPRRYDSSRAASTSSPENVSELRAKKKAKRLKAKKRAAIRAEELARKGSDPGRLQQRKSDTSTSDSGEESRRAAEVRRIQKLLDTEVKGRAKDTDLLQDMDLGKDTESGKDMEKQQGKEQDTACDTLQQTLKRKSEELHEKRTSSQQPPSGLRRLRSQERRMTGAKSQASQRAEVAVGTDFMEHSSDRPGTGVESGGTQTPT